MVKGKRSHAKKRKYSKKVAKVPRVPVRISFAGVCPDVMQVQLRYSRNGNLGGAGIATQVFRGNSCFDPDFTGIGSQPLGFDQWSAFYRRYRVVASKIVVRGSEKETNAISGLVIAPLNTSSTISNAQEILQANYRKVAYNTAFAAGTSSLTVSNYISTAKIRGGPYDIVQYEADLSALVSTNPTQQWYWHVVTFNADGSIGTIDVNANFEILYTVEFFDRETLVAS